jgi:carboxylesterase
MGALWYTPEQQVILLSMNTLPTLMPGSEPFFFPGDSTGCLCLHGFTASPAELRWLGQDLAAQGCTVYGPRLPGHGTDPRDLNRHRWKDWYAAALDGYHLLRGQCERVFVIGHSMGGLLALLVASQVPVDGAAVLAAPLRFRQKGVAMARWLRFVRPYSNQADAGSLNTLIRQEQARRGEPIVGRVRYDLWSTRAVAELFAVSQAAQQVLPRVEAPLLLIYSEGDQTVTADNMDYVRQQVRSQHIQAHLLQHSDHILPQDTDRETVFAYVSAFVRGNRNDSPAGA